MRQSVLECWIVLALNEWSQVVAAFAGDAKTVFGDEVLGHFLFNVGDVREFGDADFPFVGIIRCTHDGWHDRIIALQGELHCRFTQCVRLFDVCLGGNMSGRALEVIRHRPVVLVTEFGLDQFCNSRGYAAQLGMPKGIAGAHLGKEFTIFVSYAFGHNNGAIVIFLYGAIDLSEKLFFIESNLWKQNDVGCLTRCFCCQAASRHDPARMPPHCLQHKHLCRCLGHAGDVEPGLTDGGGNVFRYRAESWTVVRHGQIIVHCFWDTDAHNRISEFLPDLRNLVGCVL